MAEPSGRSGNAGRVVLLIDEDAKVGRLLRLTIHGPNCQVLTCTKVHDGLRTAARERPTLILMETRFEGGDGLVLAGKLMAAPGTRGSAIGFVSSDQSLGCWVRAIQLGAVDFIRKPLDARELRSRLDLAFERLEQERPQPVGGPGAQRLLAQVERIERDAATGTLRLQRAGRGAVVSFSYGKLNSAEYGSLSGAEAFNAVLRKDDWELHFEEGAVPLEAMGTDQRATVDDDAETGPGHQGRPRARSSPRVPPAQPITTGVTTETDADEVTVFDPNARIHAGAASGRTPSGVLRSVLPPTLTGLESGAESFAEETETSSTELAVAPPTLPGAQDTAESPTKSLAAVSSDPDGEPTLAADYSEDEPTIDTPAIFRPVRTDPGASPATGATAGRAVAAASSPEWTDGAPAGAAADAAPSTAEKLAQWYAAMGSPPLLLALEHDAVERALTEAASARGFTVLCAKSAQQAYLLARDRRPAAVIADAKLPDADGRDLLAGLRSDFLLRETPFIMFSASEVGEKLTERGVGAVEPILAGVEGGLSPRVELFSRLMRAAGDDGGWVDPIGIATLLRALATARFSGRLQVRHRDGRNAEVAFRTGGICGATSSADNSTGRMALFDLLGYEWNDFVISPEEQGGAPVALGKFDELIESACRQNNLLLDRAFRNGVDTDDVAVNRPALDAYAASMPPSALPSVMRLMEGEPAAVVAENGVASAAMLKSLLHDLRRKAVIRATSLRGLRVGGAAQPGADGAAATDGARRRWMVVLLTTMITVALAVAAYAIYARLSSGAASSSGASSATGEVRRKRAPVPRSTSLSKTDPGTDAARAAGDGGSAGGKDGG